MAVVIQIDFMYCTKHRIQHDSMGVSRFSLFLGTQKTYKRHAEHTQADGHATVRQEREYRVQIDVQYCAELKYSRDDRSKSNLKHAKVFTLPL